MFYKVCLKSNKETVCCFEMNRLFSWLSWLSTKLQISMRRTTLLNMKIRLCGKTAREDGLFIFVWNIEIYTYNLQLIAQSGNSSSVDNSFVYISFLRNAFKKPSQFRAMWDRNHNIWSDEILWLSSLLHTFDLILKMFYGCVCIHIWMKYDIRFEGNRGNLFQCFESKISIAKNRPNNKTKTNADS